MAGPIYLVP